MKLGDLGTFKTGGTPSRSKNEYWGDKYPWISSTALGDVYIDENAATDWISDEGLKNSSTKLIKANSLMIGIRIGVGKCSINRIPMCTSQDVISIEGIDTERYYLPYITTLINNKRHYLESLKRGATIQGITTDIIKNLQIPDIQINRQKLIADTIQVVDDMVCLSHKQLAKLDTLVKSRFIEMFGNELFPFVHVEDVCSYIVDCPHTTPKYHGELLYPAIRTTEIKDGFIDWTTMKYVAKDEYDKRTSRLKPLAGDIVYGREGTYGNAAILPEGYDFCLGQRVMLFRTDVKKCLPQYLLQALISDDVKKQADSKNTGSTVAHVNVADAKKFTIVKPPIALQNQFAAFVQQVDKSKSVLQKLLEKQELLRSALMQEYFG